MARGPTGESKCEACMNKLINFFDRSVKYVEPFLVLFAITLVLLDVYTFFKHVVPDILHHSGRAVAGAHVVWSMWLLFNVFWNQLHCTLTSPGNTLEVQEQALQSAMTYDWRWCRTCNRGKPPLAHHCSVCNKCVLKMDHHCVWMANCVGFYNYRFFVLFLFYMWVGSAYSAAVLWLHVPVMLRLSDPTWEQAGFLPFFMFVLSCSIWLAMCVLLGWHVWLVLTGQGTIDYLDNADRAAEARAAGRRWSNPYHLGLAANWQETFDVRGRWWWLTWMAPSRRRKLGNGYNLKKAGSPPRELLDPPRSSSMAARLQAV